MSDPRKPESAPDADEPKSWAPVAGAVTGAILLAIGLAVCTFGVPGAMRRVNEALGASGIGDPRELSERISHLLMISASGAGLAVAGLVVLVVSILAIRSEEEK